ncbi:MFS transporter [Galbitalea sp. SE-J8]|uniref:MFS transporter n=1 Tax=Galbitalea sp. SE-J8 TaxID=3054952 RepID=UPI00259C7E3C|nr:MFS transporter [Galbitalea sp. SE-J8]MDM4764131.1 MFS transporter [Galbitalea sp. SE-J8]
MSQPRRSHFVDLRPLRESPAFARLFAGYTISGIGAQLTIVAVGLEVYDLTASTFAVSLVGVVALVPMVLAGLYGGMLADAFDRRRVLLVSALVAWAATIGIAALSWLNVESVASLYVLTAVGTAATTVSGTARSALEPRLIRRELLPAMAALNGIATGLFITVGPALGGVLVAAIDYDWTYTVDVVLFLASLAGILSLPAAPPEGERHAPGLESIRRGLAFLRTAGNVRLSFVLDLVAMTFGRPHALFPAAATLVLGGGSVTVGVLTAAGAVGALLCSVFSGRLTGIRRHGLAVGWAIAGYGGSILGLGLVLLGAGTRGTDAAPAPVALVPLALAVLFMALSGATDNVSAIFRATIMQSAAPDAMRGRLQGIYIAVVAGGPRLGDLFVGLVALAGAIWAPPVLGGLAIIALIALLLRASPGFRRYDGAHPTP